MSWGGWFGGAPAATDCVYPELPTPTTPADFQEFLEKRFNELLANVSNDGWTKLEVPAEPGMNDIELWEKTTEGATFSWVKSTGEVPCSPKQLMELVQSPDINLLKNWDLDVTKHQIVSSPAEHITVIYTNYATPYPITHRAFVTARLRRTQPDGTEVAVSHSFNSKDFPLDANFVRGVAFSGYVISPIEGKNACRFLRLTCVDPKGNIPAWVTNMFKTKAAKSVLALRNYVIANPPK